MDLTHTFTVPTDVEETWSHFQDIASVAECFPGAAVTSAEGDTFSGNVKVKLGPIALVYSGSGTFVEKDEAAHSFVVEAKGKDKRGNGTAGATVRLSMAAAGSGGTDVEVNTDLAITGKPAQFGRGVMQDVSDKLLGQFVACLEQRLAPVDPAPTEESGGQSTASAAGPVDLAPPPEGGGGESTVGASRPVDAAPPRAAPAPAASDDALDLGAAVLPVLAKSYWKQGLAALVALAVVVKLIRR